MADPIVEQQDGNTVVSSTAEDQIDQQPVETTDGGQVEPQESAPAEEPVDGGNVEHLKRALAEQQQRAEFFQNMYMQTMQGVPQQQRPPEEPIDEDDFVNVRTAKEIIARQVKPVQDNLRSQQLMLAEQQFRIKNPDYDTVIQQYTMQVFKENPGLYERIMDLPNAPEIAYRLGTTHPTYKGKQTARATQANAQRATENINGVPSSAVKTGGQPAAGVLPDYNAMSKDDFEKELQRIKGL